MPPPKANKQKSLGGSARVSYGADLRYLGNAMTASNNNVIISDSTLSLFRDPKDASCRVCCHLSPINGRNDGLYVDTVEWETLEKSCQAGCQNCFLLYEIGSAAMTHFRLGKPYKIALGERTGYPIAVVVHYFAKTFGRIDLELYTRRNEAQLPARPWLPLSSDIATNSNSEHCQQLAKAWLHECLNEHPMCRPTRQTNPKRLLQIIGELEPTLTLIERVDSIEYIALSYCWGTAQNLKTLTTNIHLRKSGIKWEELTKTLRDAIEVARWVGIDYIWVDSLCILQDSKADWDAESIKMGEIYTNAFLVLAASSAADCTSGFLGPRPYLFQQDFMLMNNHLGHPPYTIRLRDPLNHSGIVGFNENSKASSEPLSQRAWAFQERVLASRLLSFGVNELVWACQRKAYCECGQARYDAKKEKRAHPKYLRPLVMDQWDNDKVYREWRQNIIFNFTKRQLTVTSDRLPALAGIASRIRQKTGDRYLSGIWEGDLPRALLWELAPVERAADFSRECDLPTFSWASVERPVQYSALLNRFVSQAKYLSSRGTYSLFETTDDTQNSQIVLQGRLLPALACLSRHHPSDPERYYIVPAEIDITASFRADGEYQGNYFTADLPLISETDGTTSYSYPSIFRPKSHLLKNQVSSTLLHRAPQMGNNLEWFSCWCLLIGKVHQQEDAEIYSSPTSQFVYMTDEVYYALVLCRSKSKENVFERLGLFQTDIPKGNTLHVRWRKAWNSVKTRSNVTII